MLQERAIERARQEQNQRRALLIFGGTLSLLVVVCAMLGLRMLVQPSQTIAAGSVEEYTDDQPRRFAVPQLEISKLIVRRDSTLSQDVIFVRRAQDGTWSALLGVDTLSGCFLHWDAAAARYKDINCLGSIYTIDGQYAGGLTTGEQPQDMARMPVDARAGAVFVRDEILHTSE